jgi:hypothetical protein
MALRRIVVSAVTTALLAGGAVAVSAAPAAAAPHCDPGYYKTGTALIERTSGWIRTRPDIAGGSREIQFRVTGMTKARYTYSNCDQGAVRSFPTAIQYRIKGRGGIGGWVNYSTVTDPRGWRWPDLCAGWDPVASMWRTWSCL